MLLTVLLACGPHEVSVDTGATPTTTRPGTARDISTYTVVVQAVPTLANAVTVDITPPDDNSTVTQVTCEAPDVIGSVPETTTVNADGQAGVVTLTLDGLLADTSYSCVAAGTAARPATFSFTTAPLPDALAAISIGVVEQTAGGTPGWTLFDPFTTNGLMFSTHYAVAIDPDGRVRWYVDVATFGDIDVEAVGDEGRISIGGGFRKPWPPTVYDTAGRTVEQLTLDAVGHANHALTVTADDFWFISGLTSEDVCVVQVARVDHRERWRWCLAEHGYPTEGGFNAMDVHVDDGRHEVLLSMTSSGLVFDVDYPSGAVSWTLGAAGTIVDPTWPVWTHDTRLVDCPDGTDCVLAYANNWIGETARPSLALEVGVDPATASTGARRTWSQPGWSEHHWGSVEPIGQGHWLVGIGHNEPESRDSHDSSIVEVDPATGEVLRRVSIEPATIGFYRARHVDLCGMFHHTGYCPEGG